MRAGGTSEVKEMTPEVIEICNQIKAALEEKLGAPCDVFEPKSFKSQVVAGTNYFVKVHVGNEKHVHLRIYKHFSGTTELHSHQVDKTHEDPIEYFKNVFQ